MKSIDPETQKYFSGFLVPDDSLEEWAERYELSLDSIECPFCDEPLQPSAPYMTKEYRGIIFERCMCEESPDDQSPFLYRASDPAQDKENREFASALIGHLST